MRYRSDTPGYDGTCAAGRDDGSFFTAETVKNNYSKKLAKQFADMYNKSDVVSARVGKGKRFMADKSRRMSL